MSVVRPLSEHSIVIDPVSDFSPILMWEIELGQPLPIVSAFNEQRGQTYQYAYCLIRLHTQPLGLVDFTFDENDLSPEEYIPRIWQALGKQINAHLREDGLPELTILDVTGLSGSHIPRCLQEREVFLQTAPFVSVVLSTRDRPHHLARCLRALLTQHYPGYEVIVVDNAPSTSMTADFIRQIYADEAKIRYMRENRPGLSAGRNRGILEARGEIIAFTDDDVSVDTYWLARLAQGFRITERVACVTSLLLPRELETHPQLWFEEFGGFNRGFIRRIFDQNSVRKDVPLYPLASAGLGTGAGMAFTARFLQEEGGFDLALGTGSRTGGGEDLAAFLQVIMRGNRLVYEPGSLAYHEHRRDYIDLQEQIYSYGVGFTAYLTKSLMKTPFLLFALVMNMPRGLFHLLKVRSNESSDSLEKSTHYPKELTKLALKGMVYGPLAYLQTRWLMRKMPRSLT